MFFLFPESKEAIEKDVSDPELVHKKDIMLLFADVSEAFLKSICRNKGIVSGKLNYDSFLLQ